MNLRETPEFQYGEEFERALSAWLQRKGYGILPVYNYGGAEDKAPLLERQDGGKVLPDMLAVADGHSGWVEAKRKTRADLGRISGKMETGIDKRLYEHYRHVKAESGLPVKLVFGHDQEDSVRCCEIDEHVPRFSPKFPKGHGPGGFLWIWDELHELCTLSSMFEEYLTQQQSPKT